MDSDELNKNLTKLNKNIEKQLSFKFILLKGVVYGVATVIGASVVAGIVLSILSKTIDSVDDIPLIEDVVDEIEIEKQDL